MADSNPDSLWPLASMKGNDAIKNYFRFNASIHIYCVGNEAYNLETACDHRHSSYWKLPRVAVSEYVVFVRDQNLDVRAPPLC